MLKTKINEIPITKLCELNLKNKSEIENYFLIWKTKIK